MGDRKTDLEQALRISWSAETSHRPKRWSPENPARDQCVPTALVVQEYLGGDIVFANVSVAADAAGRRTTNVGHYFNRIDGKDVDFTANQFPPDTVIPVGVPRPKGEGDTRHRLISIPQVRARYVSLREQVAAIIGEPDYARSLPARISR